MNQSVVVPDVLTLEEAAGYLRLSPAAVERNADRGTIPGRRIDEAWRFSKAALDAWLCHRDQRQILLRQVGALSQDEHLPKILNKIYEERGRPEVETE